MKKTNYPETGEYYKDIKKIMDDNITVKDYILNNLEKLVCVITDKQCITCTKDITIHFHKLKHISSYIGKKVTSEEELPKSYAYIMAYQNGSSYQIMVIITGNKISNNQYEFLNNISKEVDDCYKEGYDRLVEIIINIDERIYYTIDDLKQFIDKNFTQDKYIIGDTLPKEIIIKNFKDNFKKHNKLKLLLEDISTIESLINDEYYLEIIKEVLPNYIQIINIKNDLVDLDIDIDNINIFDEGLLELLNNIKNDINKVIK